MSDSVSSSSAVEPKKVKAKIKRKRVVESETPGRTNVTDFRRTYSQLLLNAFNSCDLDKLRYTLENFCTPDLYSCCRYEGITNNPYASNGNTTTKSIENHMTMWSALFQSAPDFLFQGEFLEAFIADDNRCVVRSKFTFHGTRVADIKVAAQVNDTVLKDKLSHKDYFPTTENELMAQIHQQLADSYAQSADDDPLSETPDSFEDEEELQCDDPAMLQDFKVPRENARSDVSLFYGKGVKLTEPGVKMYAETNLMTQGMALRCSGTLTVYINAANKINEFEFLYTAMNTDLWGWEDTRAYFGEFTQNAAEFYP